VLTAAAVRAHDVFTSAHNMLVRVPADGEVVFQSAAAGFHIAANCIIIAPTLHFF
jgi:hypothetical protein